MISNEELDELYGMFGDKLPHPLHYPKIFEYYHKIFLFYKSRKIEHNDSENSEKVKKTYE